MEKKFLTADEAANLFGVSKDELRLLAEEGEFRALADRGSVRYRVDELEAYFGKRGSTSTPPEVEMTSDDEVSFIEIDEEALAEYSGELTKPATGDVDLDDFFKDLSDADVTVKASSSDVVVFPAPDATVELASSSNEIIATSDAFMGVAGGSSSSDVVAVPQGTSSSDVVPVSGSSGDQHIVIEPSPEGGSDSDIVLKGTDDLKVGPVGTSSSDVVTVDSRDLVDLIDTDFSDRTPAVRVAAAKVDAGATESSPFDDLDDLMGGKPATKSSAPASAHAVKAVSGDTGSVFDEEVVNVATASLGESGIALEAGDTGITLDAGDSGLTLETGDSGLALVSGDSGLTLETGDSGITLQKEDSGLSLADGDSGITLDKGDSGITLEEGDSGLALEDGDSGLTVGAADSGLSLEAGDSGIGLDAGDSGIMLTMSDSGLTLSGSDSDVKLAPSSMEIPAMGVAATPFGDETVDSLDADFDLEMGETGKFVIDDELGSAPTVNLIIDDDEEAASSDFGSVADLDISEDLENASAGFDSISDDDEILETSDADFSEGAISVVSDSLASIPIVTLAKGPDWGLFPSLTIIAGALFLGVNSWLLWEATATMWNGAEPSGLAASLVSTLAGLF